MAEFWQWYQAHHEALRSILFLFGFFLACVGVYLGFRRLAATEKQANTAERNLFNDRLGRGVALLSDDKMTMRSAGVRVLENLAESVKDDPEEHRLVFNILLDFVRDRAASPINHEGKQEFFSKWPVPQPRQKRLDIELAIRALGNIALDGWRDNGELNLSRLDLRRLVFYRFDLNGAQLGGANLQATNLQMANLKNAFLFQANLNDANLSFAELEGATLQMAHLQNTDLSSAKLNDADLDFSDFFGADISGAERDGWEKEVLAASVYSSLHPPANVRLGQFNLISKPDELRYYYRAYEWKEEAGTQTRYFVESDKPESGQDVDEWIKKEIAEAEGKN